MVIKRIYLVWIALFTIILDQVLKEIIELVTPNIKLLPFLSIVQVNNFGAGFGILQNQRIPLIIISIIVLGIIAYYYRSTPEATLPVVAVGLILGGTVGNLIDRILRGYVVDFINFSFWPTFNVADSALVIGVILLAWYWWKN